MRLLVLLVSAFLTALSGNAAMARVADGSAITAASIEAVALSKARQSADARPRQGYLQLSERWAALPPAQGVRASIPLFDQRLRF